MVVGPLLTSAFGLSGLFLATGVMALIGIVIIMFMVPHSTGTLQHRESGVAKQAMMPILRHPDLLRLCQRATNKVNRLTEADLCQMIEIGDRKSVV